MKTYLTIFITFIFYCCHQSDTTTSSIKNNTFESTSNNKTTTTLTENIANNVKEVDSINQYWSNKKITSATLYCYLPEADDQSQYFILDKKLKLHSTVIDSLTYELPFSVTNFLNEQIINVTNFKEKWVEECFQPHHGIVLKNEKGVIVGHISICFECNQYRLLPENVNYIPMKVFKNICIQAKVPIERKELSNIFYKSKSSKNKIQKVK